MPREGGSDPARGLPTLETVAAQAGVSRSTVSRVVNGSPKVRPDVVDAVNATIARMNYVPNRAARSLASRQTYAIALLVPEETTRFFGDPYFAAIVKGITARLEPTDYILNLLVASSDPTRKTRRYLRSGSVDGALVVSHHASDRDLTELNEAVPMVFGGRPAAQALSNSYYVDVDNLDGSRQATQHLIERGARRIATITGPPDMPASIDRLAGWRQVMAERGHGRRRRRRRRLHRPRGGERHGHAVGPAPRPGRRLRRHELFEQVVGGLVLQSLARVERLDGAPDLLRLFEPADARRRDVRARLDDPRRRHALHVSSPTSW